MDPSRRKHGAKGGGPLSAQSRLSLPRFPSGRMFSTGLLLRKKKKQTVFHAECGRPSHCPIALLRCRNFFYATSAPINMNVGATVVLPNLHTLTTAAPPFVIFVMLPTL